MQSDFSRACFHVFDLPEVCTVSDDMADKNFSVLLILSEIPEEIVFVSTDSKCELSLMIETRAAWVFF